LTASLAISGVLLLAMVVMAGYAVVSLPSGARVPVNAGMPEHSLWLAKPAGLAVWLAAGAVAFAALSWLALSGVATNWVTSMRVTLAPAVLFVVLAGEAGAVITARQAARGVSDVTASTAQSGMSERHRLRNRCRNRRGHEDGHEDGCGAASGRNS
jgi:hypothetical protein